MESNLINRIEILERNCRLWRRVTLASLVTFGVVLSLGQQSSPGVVEAREFRVVGPSGETFASLGLDPDGGVHLVLKDPEGKPRVLLATMIEDAEGPIDGVSSTLWLSGGSEKPGITLVSAANLRKLSLYDLQGHPRLSLKLRDYMRNDVAELSLDFEDAQTRELISLSVPAASTERPLDRTALGNTMMNKASPQLGLRTADGGKMLLKVWGDGQPSIDVWDKDRENILKVP